MSGLVVQNGYNVDDSGGTATTIAVVITGVTAGNTLVAHGGWAGTGNTATVSDGSAFSTGDAQRNDTTNNQAGQVYYRENVGSGSHTVTLTISTSAAFRRLRVYEVSGLATASSLDKDTGQNQATPGTGANAVSSGATAATTNANDFVMGFSQNILENDPGTGTVTAGTGYSLTGTNLIMCVESKSVAATGAQTATFTQSVNNTRTTHVVAFKEASAAAASDGALVGRLRLSKGPAQRFRTATRGFANPATDLTIALTGQDISGALGTLGPALSLALSGQAIAISAGTMIPATSKALTGSALASSAGTLTPVFSLALTGSALTGSLGTLVPTLSIPLNGLLITIGQGSVTAPGGGGDVTAALTGIAISTGQGTLAPSMSKALSGSALAMSLGTLIPGTSKALTGSALTSAQGSIGPTLAVAMVGSVITASTGALTDPSAITGAIDNSRIVRVTVRMDLRVATLGASTLRVSTPKTTIH